MVGGSSSRGRWRRSGWCAATANSAAVVKFGSNRTETKEGAGGRREKGEGPEAYQSTGACGWAAGSGGERRKAVGASGGGGLRLVRSFSVAASLLSGKNAIYRRCVEER